MPTITAELAQQCPHWHKMARSHSPWIRLAFALLGPVRASRRAVRARRRVLYRSRRQRRQKEAAAADEHEAVRHARRWRAALSAFTPPPARVAQRTRAAPRQSMSAVLAKVPEPRAERNVCATSRVGWISWQSYHHDARGPLDGHRPRAVSGGRRVLGNLLPAGAERLLL